MSTTDAIRRMAEGIDALANAQIELIDSIPPTEPPPYVETDAKVYLMDRQYHSQGANLTELIASDDRLGEWLYTGSLTMPEDSDILPGQKVTCDWPDGTADEQGAAIWTEWLRQNIPWQHEQGTLICCDDEARLGEIFDNVQPTCAEELARRITRHTVFRSQRGRCIIGDYNLCSDRDRNRRQDIDDFCAGYGAESLKQQAIMPSLYRRYMWQPPTADNIKQANTARGLAQELGVPFIPLLSCHASNAGDAGQKPNAKGAGLQAEYQFADYVEAMGPFRYCALYIPHPDMWSIEGDWSDWCAVNGVDRSTINAWQNETAKRFADIVLECIDAWGEGGLLDDLVTVPY